MQMLVSLADISSVKKALMGLLPNVKSSHRVEAMARGLGWNTNAALLAELANSPMIRVVEDKPFRFYLIEHGFPDVPYGVLDEAVVQAVFSQVRDEIRAVMEAHPNLTSNGFRYFYKRMTPEEREVEHKNWRDRMLLPSGVEEFIRAKEFLATKPRTQNVTRHGSSYGYKHEAEKFHEARGVNNAYVSNGMLIAAAYSLGFLVKPISETPNALLNIGSSKTTKSASATPSVILPPGSGSARKLAWQNMMIAGVNAGLEQGFFGLNVNDNHWQGKYGIYRFDFSGLPAIAYVGDAGFGALSVHVAINPAARADDFIRAANGYSAGEAFASGWLEREKGKWLQVGNRPTFKSSRQLVNQLAIVKIEPRGYAKQGKFMF